MAPEFDINTRVALLELALSTNTDRLAKVEASVDGVRKSINRGLGALCILLGGTLANLLVSIHHLGK